MTNLNEKPSMFAAELNGQSIRVALHTALEHSGYVTPTAALLAEYVALEPTDRVLMLGCSHGALAVSLASRLARGTVTLTDPSLLALATSRKTLRLNQVTNAEVVEAPSVLPEYADSFDHVVIDIPQSRTLARRWLVEAHAALRSEGRVFVAGAKKQGVQSIIADTEALFGSANVLGYRKGCRVVVATKTDLIPESVAWASEPGIAPETWYQFTAELHDRTLDLVSLPGIFAYDRVDEGTRMLLDHLVVPSGGRVLDIGCGYGIIGIVTAQQGADRVDMVDINLLALAAAAENCSRHGLQNVNVLPSDGLRAVNDRDYDLIVTNPPFHAGQQVNRTLAHAMINDGSARLNRGGRFVLVANRFLPYDQVMKPFFSHVERVAENGSYHVLVGSGA